MQRVLPLLFMFGCGQEMTMVAEPKIYEVYGMDVHVAHAAPVPDEETFIEGLKVIEAHLQDYFQAGELLSYLNNFRLVWTRGVITWGGANYSGMVIEDWKAHRMRVIYVGLLDGKRCFTDTALYHELTHIYRHDVMRLEKDFLHVDAIWKEVDRWGKEARHLCN